MRADRTNVRQFFQLSGATPLTGKMRQLLESERGVSFAEAGDLRLLAKAGNLGSHPVTYFRVFNQAGLPATAEEAPDYDNLAPELILHSGHIEEDTTIVLNVSP